MKKQIIIAVCLLTIFTGSCTKKADSSSSATPGVPISTFNISFNGKTFTVTTGDNISTVGGTTGSTTIILNADGSYSSGFTVGVGAGNDKITVLIEGTKRNASTAIGTYISGDWFFKELYTDSWYGQVSVTDNTDGGKVYSCVPHDTTSSSITVSVSNSSEVKGTFNVLLTYNGTNYLAIGDFDYKH